MKIHKHFKINKISLKQAYTLAELGYIITITNNKDTDYRQRVKDVINAIEAVRGDIRVLKRNAESETVIGDRMGDLAALEMCLVGEAKALLNQLGVKL